MVSANDSGTGEPAIQMVENGDEVTLLIDQRQVMQAWEMDLMHQSADLLCTFGSDFLEVGLGLGLSALRIAGNPATRRHRVIEKYGRVIDMFRARHPNPPVALEIVHADFFEYVHALEPLSLDGIFFDPYLPRELWQDEALWDTVMASLVRTLRPGGAFIPYFSYRPVLWDFVHYFDRVIVERRSFTSYPTTEYAPTEGGTAYIQCFVKVANS